MACSCLAGNYVQLYHDPDSTSEGESRAKSCWQLGTVFSQSLLDLLLVRGLPKLLVLYKGLLSGLGLGDMLWKWIPAGKVATRASTELPDPVAILPCDGSLSVLKLVSLSLGVPSRPPANSYDTQIYRHTLIHM